MKHIQTLFFIALLAPVCALAQLNESDTSRFQLRAGVTGVRQQGNVDALIVKSRLDFSWMPVKRWVLKSQNNSEYQEFFKQKADNDLYSRNYLYYRPERRVYPFLIGYISANYRRKIDWRYFAGGGSTVQLLRKQQHILKASAGLVYEQTQFAGTVFNYSEYNGKKQNTVMRATCYLAGWHTLGSSRTRIYYTAYWQPSLSSGNNYRLQADAGMDFPVWRGLSFNVLYTWTHEHVVVRRIVQDDKQLTFGLSWRYTKQRSNE